MQLKRNQLEFQEKLQIEMEKKGLDLLILTKAESMFYATGYCSRYAFTGALGNTVVVMPRTGKATVVCAQFEAQAAELECPDINVVSYPIWLYIADFEDAEEKPTQPDLNKTFRLAVDVARTDAPAAKKIGIDASSMPYERMDFLSEVYGRENIRDCGDVLIEARKIKTEWEIQILRENAQMSERQFYETAKATEVGMTEEDIMYLFTKFGHEQSHDVLGVRHAHTYGPYYSPSYIPRKHPLKNGDIVRLDGGIMRLGYVSDLGRSYVVGDYLAPERAAIYETLWGAYDIGLEMIGPGVRPADVFDRMLARVKQDIPLLKRGHFGHSTGCLRGEEYPFISNTNPGVFEPGMIFCLETPYYSSMNSSYNIEDTLLITENGYERFTHANRSLFWPERE